MYFYTNNRCTVPVSLWWSPHSAAVLTPPTELLITSYCCFENNIIYLHAEHTVTVNCIKMGHDDEDQVWVKVDIWASVVYFSRDCLSLRGLSRPGKCKISAALGKHVGLWKTTTQWHKVLIRCARVEFFPLDPADKGCSTGGLFQGSVWVLDFQPRWMTTVAREALELAGW